MTSSYTENPFLCFETESPVTKPSLTKMNVIVPIIPKPIRNTMDLVLLIAGVSLNISLDLFIVLNSSMHSSFNCYIVGLTFTNFVILLEPLERIIEWTFDVDLKMNLDYIFLMSFGTSLLTMILLNIEIYITICQKNSSLGKSFLKISTAIKGNLMIWATCFMAIGIELKLYDHFEKEIMQDIYVSSTIMFLIFPFFIFIMLDYFILYDLKVSILLNETWPGKDIERFIFLIGVNVAFLLTMVPYRIARAAAFLSYYNNIIIEITYVMIKIYPTILPVIFYATLKMFHHTFETSQRHESFTTI